MVTPRRIWLSALLLAVIGGGVWYLTRPREPVYQGKTLNAWLRQELQYYQAVNEAFTLPGGVSVSLQEEFHRNDKTFNDLLQEKGPEMLPSLIKALNTKDNRFWKPYESLRSRLPRFISNRMPAWPEPRLVRKQVPFLIGKIGFGARAAVPALSECALNEQDLSARRGAILALYHIGPVATAAVPNLLVVLKQDTDSTNRGFAAFSLMAIHPDARQAVPALTEALQDSQSVVRIFAAQALGKYGPEANAAGPLLLKIASDPASSSNEVRTARDALKKIDPAATTPELFDAAYPPLN